MCARRVLQEKPQGEFATLWKTSLEEDTGLEQVELNAALADIMAAKDATEQVTAVLVRVSSSPSPSPSPSPRLAPALALALTLTVRPRGACFGWHAHPP